MLQSREFGQTFAAWVDRCNPRLSVEVAGALLRATPPDDPEAETLDGVRDARRLGTIAACEIGGGEGYLAAIGPALAAHFRERDLLVRPMGNTVYVMPPYCIDEPDLDRIYTAIQEAAERFAA